METSACYIREARLYKYMYSNIISEYYDTRSKGGIMLS